MSRSRFDIATAPVGMGFARLILSDYRCFADFRNDTVWKRRLLLIPRLLVNPSLHAAMLLRFSNASPRWMHWFWRNLLIWKHSMDCGYRATIGPRLFLPHPFGIAIGPRVVIGADVRISHNVSIGPTLGSPECPVIGDGTILLPNCSVLGPVAVGPRAVISVHSFVDRDVPAGGVAYTRRAEIGGPPESGESAAERATHGLRIQHTKIENVSSEDQADVA